MSKRWEDDEVEVALDKLAALLRSKKPEDRSSVDRHYAILITDLDKLIAYYHTYVFPEVDLGE